MMQELISYITIMLLLTAAIHAKSSVTSKSSSTSSGSSSSSSDSSDSTESSSRDTCSCNPCLNGGTCESKGNGYKCHCPSGYRGKDCQKERHRSESSSSSSDASSRDTCSCNPCLNGGTCESKGNGYTCHCPSGYRGKDCQKERHRSESSSSSSDESSRDSCSCNPCQNGGTCESKGNRYKCHCPSGYRGKYCQKEINRSESSSHKNDASSRDSCSCNPCQNGGTCEKMVRLNTLAYQFCKQQPSIC